MRLRRFFSLLVLAACSPGGSGAPGRANDPLAQTSVPVLELPAEFMNGVVITAERAWYGISYRDEGVTVYVHATNTFVDAPSDMVEMEGDVSIRGVRGFSTFNEGVRVLTWVERDAGYSIDVECVDSEDVRCVEDAFVRDIAERMVAR